MPYTPKKVLVTGGCGFIGSCYVRMLLNRHPDIHVRNIDALTYSGNPDNVAEVADSPNYEFIKGDIRDSEVVRQAVVGVDTIVHFAAEAQVDKSITGPEVFTTTNVLGTQVLLDMAREAGISRFHYVSTDEIYGHLGKEGYFTEETPLAPNSPYSASKAGGDLLCRAYHRTYDFPVTVTRCSNNFGTFPRMDNLIPVLIGAALADKPLPLYGDGQNVRDWLYVEDHCDAIHTVLTTATPGAVYNVGGRSERTNLEVAKAILAELGKPESLITFVQDRPGHDFRYAIDPSKIDSELGWTAQHSFEEALRTTVHWYRDNPEWVEAAKARATTTPAA